MKLTDRQIEEFKELYYQRFGVNISNEDARELGLQLIGLIRAAYKPIRKDEYEEVQKSLPRTSF